MLATLCSQNKGEKFKNDQNIHFSNRCSWVRPRFSSRRNPPTVRAMSLRQPRMPNSTKLAKNVRPTDLTATVAVVIPAHWIQPIKACF